VGAKDRGTGPFRFLNPTPNPNPSSNMKHIALLTLVLAALTLGACGKKKQAYPTAAPAPVVYAK